MKASRLLGLVSIGWRTVNLENWVPDLKSNSLLLSMIATIFHLGKRLPERRADLYENAVWMLLQRRFGPNAGGSDELVRRMRKGLLTSPCGVRAA